MTLTPGNSRGCDHSIFSSGFGAIRVPDESYASRAWIGLAANIPRRPCVAAAPSLNTSVDMRRSPLCDADTATDLLGDYAPTDSEKVASANALMDSKS